MNTHQKFQTIDHVHMDWMFRLNGEPTYPDSALVLVQAGDGRWFLQQDFGKAFGGFPGVVASNDDLTTVPEFHADFDAAITAAFTLMKQIYTGYSDGMLTEFLTGGETV